VSDTGAGIPEESLNGIFEPYFTTKKPEKGQNLAWLLFMAAWRTMAGALRLKANLVYFTFSSKTGKKFQIIYY